MEKGSWASLLTAVINVGCYGTMVLLALSICLLAIAPWVDPPRIEVGLAVPTAFRIAPQAHPITSSPPDMENVHLEQACSTLRFSPRSRLLVAGTACLLIAALSLILWVLLQLRAVFRTLRAGKPFVPDNAIRIQRIAFAVIVGEAARATLVFTGTHYAAGHFAIQGLQLEVRPDLNLIVIVCGLILLAIAEVFRAGTRLDEEQSLTI
jgi:hypothetical protein